MKFDAAKYSSTNNIQIVFYRTSNLSSSLKYNRRIAEAEWRQMSLLPRYRGINSFFFNYTQIAEDYIYIKIKVA